MAQQKSLGVEKVPNVICHAGQLSVLALHQIMIQKIWQAILPRARVGNIEALNFWPKNKKSKSSNVCAGKYCNVASNQDINSLGLKSTKRPCSSSQSIASTKI